MATKLPAQTTRFIKPRSGSPGSLFRIGAHFNLDGINKIVHGMSPERLAGIVGEALEPVKTLAQTLVHKKTWALHNSIRIGIEELSNSKVVIVVTAGDDVVFYAPYQEFGTSKHPPYPYLTPAWHTYQNEVKEHIRSEIAKMIKELAR